VYEVWRVITDSDEVPIKKLRRVEMSMSREEACQMAQQYNAPRCYPGSTYEVLHNGEDWVDWRGEFK